MRHGDSVERRINSMVKALESIKARQLSGTSNVIGYQSQSASTWDVNQTVNTSVGELQYFFCFTADQQKAPFVSFHPNIQMDDVPNDAGNGFFVSGIEQFAILGGFTSAVNFEKSVGFLVTINRSDPSDFNLKIKMRCLATDNGTITVQML